MIQFFQTRSRTMVDSKDVISVKIEKINDTQIRCTLTSEDLADRQLKLSELAYGSEKAKDLFRDMMLQAQDQFGFEADNVPLMIEAIPITPDSIVLIITKVEDPEELDTRFSKFAPFKGNKPADTVEIDGADNIIDIFQKICESRLKNKSSNTECSKESDEAASDSSEKPAVNLIRQYTFTHLDDVIAASHGLNGFFTGRNTLYKTSANESYQLIIHQSSCSPQEFNKVCNILSEYGQKESGFDNHIGFFAEHCECIIAEHALHILRRL